MKHAALALMLALATASAAQAQTPPTKKPPVTAAKVVVRKPVAMSATSSPRLREMRPGLEAKAKVKTDAATTTALATVPGGTLESRTIEERGGRLVYAFTIKAADRKHDVMVDATTGRIVPMPAPAAKRKG